MKRHLLMVLLAASIALGAGATFTTLAIPGGTRGVGFDDLRFIAATGELLVPAGRTGKLDIVAAKSRRIETIGGFSRGDSYEGGHGEGVTSADEQGGFIFVTDRTTRLLSIVEAGTRKIVARAALASGPDYVRVVSATGELWVTEPGAERIEVFALDSAGGFPKPAHRRFIAVPGGPETLLIDDARGRAYTNLHTGTTVAIDLRSGQVVARWPNGCRESHGLALDSKRGFVFVGCAEGRLAVLSTATGRILGSVDSGDGVDIIAYSPKLRHVYMPGAASATMAIIGISARGTPTVLATVKTAPEAHCVAADDLGNAWVCDPRSGRLLIFADPYRSS